MTGTRNKSVQAPPGGYVINSRLGSGSLLSSLVSFVDTSCTSDPLKVTLLWVSLLEWLPLGTICIQTLVLRKFSDQYGVNKFIQVTNSERLNRIKKFLCSAKTTSYREKLWKSGENNPVLCTSSTPVLTACFVFIFWFQFYITY